MAAKRKFELMTGGKAAKKNKKEKTGGRKKLSSSGLNAPGIRGVLAAAGIVLLCLLAAAGLYTAKKYTVQTITVEGNVHYSSEEIIAMVMTDRLSYNSLYLSLQYHNREIRDIPFIETMNVKIVSPDTIRILVYEKSVAGYVEYMGRYLYFDRDGIVVESSETKTVGVPQVTGITFDHVVLYEPLPVKDDSVFQKILSITQMLSKYEISTDKIYFNEASEITLYFDRIRVRLGTGDLEEKIMRLNAILPRLEGESGVLQMENYTGEKENVTFERD